MTATDVSGRTTRSIEGGVWSQRLRTTTTTTTLGARSWREWSRMWGTTNTADDVRKTQDEDAAA